MRRAVLHAACSAQQAARRKPGGCSETFWRRSGRRHITPQACVQAGSMHAGMQAGTNASLSHPMTRNGRHAPGGMRLNVAAPPRFDIVMPP